MPVRARWCFVAACDVCDETLTDFDTESTLHFDDETTAEQIAQHSKWLVLPRTSILRLVCPTEDEQHRAAINALLPPEPVTQIPGQLALDGTEEP